MFQTESGRACSGEEPPEVAFAQRAYGSCGGPESFNRAHAVQDRAWTCRGLECAVCRCGNTSRDDSRRCTSRVAKPAGRVPGSASNGNFNANRPSELLGLVAVVTGLRRREADGAVNREAAITSSSRSSWPPVLLSSTSWQLSWCHIQKDSCPHLVRMPFFGESVMRLSGIRREKRPLKSINLPSIDPGPQKKNLWHVSTRASFKFWSLTSIATLCIL